MCHLSEILIELHISNAVGKPQRGDQPSYLKNFYSLSSSVAGTPWYGVNKQMFNIRVTKCRGKTRTDHHRGLIKDARKMLWRSEMEYISKDRKRPIISSIYIHEKSFIFYACIYLETNNIEIYFSDIISGYGESKVNN